MRSKTRKGSSWEPIIPRWKDASTHSSESRSGLPMRRFVILEHARDGIHWDVMVEVEPGGDLRTWTIDAEPCPGRDLPARALPDHRRAYLTFEGEISGNRGTVRRWDEGTCEVEAWEPGLVRLVLDGRQLLGLVELVSISGEGSASGAGGGSTSDWTFRGGKLRFKS